MAASLSPPRLLPSGDSAITVEFFRHIDDAANRRVLALDRRLARERIAGVIETVPTYRSLLVHYDPTQFDFETLGKKLTELALAPLPPTENARRWRIPVAYGGEYGIDLEDFAKALGITPDDVVARYRSAACRRGSNVSPVRAAGTFWVAPPSEPTSCIAIRSFCWSPAIA